jgi:hypothetical protein
MSTKLIAPTASERDGTSQAGRASDALSPQYVVVDERSPEDILAFVREYAKTLVYYGDDDLPDGDFSAFLGSLSPAAIAAFMKAPSSVDQDSTPALFRPHFTLFLAYLRLLEDARVEINRLTHRHLDFHYRRFLGIQARKAVPDRVNTLFSLAASADRILVPAGTALSAGVDSIGQDRIYCTGRDLVVNRARIERVSSLYVERDIVGIQKSWHDHRNDPEAGRFEMLQIAYGRPLPGDPLPDYPSDTPISLQDDDATDALLVSLTSLVKFSKQNLFLTLPELRVLILLAQTDGDLAVVTANKAAKFKGIIDSISLQINPEYEAPTDAGLSFHSYADAALGPLVVPGHSNVTTLAGYWSALLQIENYFGMSIEDFETLVDKIMVNGADWDAAYEQDAAVVASLFEDAYREKLRTDRMTDLAVVRNAQLTAAAGYTAMLQRTLGDEVTGEAISEVLEDRLGAFLTEKDLALLDSAYSESRWDDVYGLLTHAISTRLGDQIPQKVTWLNVYPARDARSAISTRGAPNVTGDKPFLPFGAPVAADPLVLPTPLLGFAITSPILALSGGSRTITLTMGLRASGYDFERLQAVITENFGKVDAFGRPMSPLVFEVSTEAGWVRCSSPLDKLPVFGDYDTLLSTDGVSSNWHDHAGSPGLRLVLFLPESEAAVAPMATAIDGLDPRYPALRILMQPVWSEVENRYITYYRELSSLFVGAVHIKVEVSGLMPTALESDDMVLDPKKPFEPFGSSPASGSRLMIGHPEVITKPLEKLAFHFQWMGAPADLATHYASYDIAASGVAPNFVVNVKSVDRSGARSLVTSAALFSVDSSAETTIATVSLIPSLPADYSSLSGAPLGNRVSTWKRRLQWELGPVDFQHRAYPKVAGQRALALATDSPRQSDVTYYQVNPPYTPKLQSLTLDYTSSVEFVLLRTNSTSQLERAYHVHPFSVVELETQNVSEELPFLPRYDRDSEFYIGFADVSLPETVTLLVEVDEASADRDVVPPEVTWSQLSGNRWIPLGNQVISDATRGFQKSGVIEFSLAAAEPSSLLGPNLAWVRATISHDHAGICDVRALHTQAVESVFQDRGNAPGHYKAPLPSGTITKLETPVEGITGVMQPYPSHGGRMAEHEGAFANRVSERLRHKQRALSSWDYERIVLDAFPEIFKTKCIPTTESAPGVVEVLVIPDVRAMPSNEFGPKAPIALLGTIQEYLSARAPRSASVRVRNASYRAVRVRLGVRFTEKSNPGYWMGRLNDELNRFLSPWAYDEGADIVVGGKIHASSIVEFVDRRSYVDYVAGISLFYTDDEGERFTFLRPPGDAGGAYCVEAGRPDRVLVAYPQHRIDLLTSAHYDARKYSGISYAELEMDFVIG